MFKNRDNIIINLFLVSFIRLILFTDRCYTVIRCPPSLACAQAVMYTQAESAQGSIDLHELKVLMRALGFQVKKQDVVKYVHEIDPQVTRKQQLHSVFTRFSVHTRVA